MHTIVRAIEVILAVIFLVIIGFMFIGGSFTDKPEEKPAVTSNEFIDTAEPIVSQTLSTERLTSNTAPSEEFELWTEEEVTVLAKMLWGEARGVPSDTEKAACVWCVLNRVDQGMGTIVEVVTAPYQFVGYQEDHPVDPDLKELCEDVLERWYREKSGETDVGRVLPSDYLFFTGDGEHNYFRNAYKNGEIWTWDYESPYEN